MATKNTDGDQSEPAMLDLGELRDLARELGLAGAERLKKPALAARVARAQALSKATLATLRPMAVEAGVDRARQLPKKALIAKLVEHEFTKAGSNETQVEMVPSDEQPIRIPVAEVFKQVLGWAMGMSALVGLILCLLVLIALPFAAVRAGEGSQAVLETSALQVRTVVSTAASAIDALERAALALDDGSLALGAVHNTLEASQPFLDSVQNMLGHDFPDILETTRQSILSAGASAQAIDQVLRALSSIRFLTGVDYRPEQSLDQSLEQVAAGLEPLPESLRVVAQDLGSVGDSLEQVNPTILATGEELGLMSTSLRSSAERLRDQLDRFAGLEDTLQLAAERAQSVINGMAFLAGLALVWIAMGQTAVLYTGILIARAGPGGTPSAEGEG